MRLTLKILSDALTTQTTGTPSIFMTFFTSLKINIRQPPPQDVRAPVYDPTRIHTKQKHAAAVQMKPLKVNVTIDTFTPIVRFTAYSFNVTAVEQRPKVLPLP